MRTIRFTLEYDGTSYHGWQRQSRLPTIQAVLESAIRQIVSEPVKVTGASRTDAGVHALGQVAHFMSSVRLTAAEWQRAVNAHLPPDIAVVRAEEAPEGFHARRWAHSKVYRYVILSQTVAAPLQRLYAWHVRWPLDVEAMAHAARSLHGSHECAAFTVPQPGRSTACHIIQTDVTRHGHQVRITLEANRFLQQMVRRVVGTLVEIGRGRLSPSVIADLLQHRSAGSPPVATPTAPACGLFLVEVRY